MNQLDKKYYVLAGILVLAVSTGAFMFSENGKQTPTTDTPDTTSAGEFDWKKAELTDFNSGEEYTIEKLDKPVLVETFAVWCSVCLSQQNEVKKFHRQSDINSVALDIDPNEDAEKVRSHAKKHSFDWRYSVASSKITEDMVDEFSGSIRIPPRAPMVLVCEDGARQLPDGVKPVSKLQQEVEKGC